MLSIKQGRTKYHFLSLWYDTTWDWTVVSRTIRQTLYSLSQWNKLPRVHELYEDIFQELKRTWYKLDKIYS